MIHLMALFYFMSKTLRTYLNESTQKFPKNVQCTEEKNKCMKMFREIKKETIVIWPKETKKIYLYFKGMTFYLLNFERQCFVISLYFSPPRKNKQ